MQFIHLHIIKRLHISPSSFTIHIKFFTISHDIYYMICTLSNMAHIGLSKPIPIMLSANPAMRKQGYLSLGNSKRKAFYRKSAKEKLLLKIIILKIFVTHGHFIS